MGQLTMSQEFTGGGESGGGSRAQRDTFRRLMPPRCLTILVVFLLCIFSLLAINFSLSRDLRTPIKASKCGHVQTLVLWRRSQCRLEFSEFEADLVHSSLCSQAAWHALAAEVFCGTMHRLEAQFHLPEMKDMSEFLFPMDVAPLAADAERANHVDGSPHVPMSNLCYSTLASLSDELSQNLERNNCSLCSNNNRLLSYCYFLLFRAASLTMRVARTQNELHQFSVLISRVKEVDANTWVTGEYPKRVAQGLASPGTTEFFNFEVLKHVLKDCNSDTIVVNVGANDGFYTFASSTRGCKVISFEPQIGCLQNLYFTAMLPQFVKPPLIYNAFLSDSDFSVDSGTTCDGGAQFTTKGIRTSNPDYSPDQEPGDWQNSKKIAVKSMRLKEAVQDDIKLLLIDVEGAEVSVLNACESLLATRSIHHAIIEWSVSRWSRFGLNVSTGVSQAVALAKNARWECRLNSGNVVTMPSSEFLQGDRLADLFSSNTNGRTLLLTSYEAIVPRVFVINFYFLFVLLCTCIADGWSGLDIYCRRMP
jgi:FkbM family methyltransferase